MRFLICALLFFLARPTLAASVTDIAAQANGNISTKFLRTVDWEWAGKGVIQHVEYGHSSVGWFRTSRFAIQGDVLQLKVVPPTYRAAVEFRAVLTSGERRPLGTKSFLSPVGAEFSHIQPDIKEGQAAQPFLALAGALPYVNLTFTPPEAAPNAAFVYIVNRLGEVVWIHFPDGGRTVLRHTLEMRRVANGLALYAPKEGLFEEVTLAGTVLRRIENQMLLPVAQWQRGFLFDGKELLVAGRQKFFERNLQRPWAPPVVGDAPIMRSVSGLKQEIAWRSLAHIWPSTNQDGETKERLASVETDREGRVYLAINPSGRLVVIDRNKTELVGVWRPRSRSKFLHALPVGDEVFALYEDGSVWHCALPCDGGFRRWVDVKTYQPWSRGRLVDAGQGRLGVLGVSSLDHSFRRRNIAPDRYIELSRATGKQIFAMEIPQNYHSPSTTVVPLATLLGEVWSRALPVEGEP